MDKRDAKADLEIAEAVARGDWQVRVTDISDKFPSPGWFVAALASFEDSDGDMKLAWVSNNTRASEDECHGDEALRVANLLALSHKALPHWIRRAVEAESQVAVLRAALESAEWVNIRMLAPIYHCPTCGVHDPGPHTAECPIHRALSTTPAQAAGRLAALEALLSAVETFSDNHDTMDLGGENEGLEGGDAMEQVDEWLGGIWRALYDIRQLEKGGDVSADVR